MKKLFLLLTLLSGVAPLSAMETVRDEEKRLKEQFPIGIVLERVDRVNERAKALLMENPAVSEKRRRELTERGGFVWREIVVGHSCMHNIPRIFTMSENGASGCFDPYDRWKVIGIKSNL